MRVMCLLCAAFFALSITAADPVKEKMPEPMEEHVQVQQNRTGGEGELLHRTAGRMNKWQDYMTPLSPYYDSGESYCPFNMRRYNSRCFAFIDMPMTWIEAEEYCIHVHRANLVSIHDQGEYDFIQGSLETTGLAWIGGNNAVDTSVWLWSDGSEFGFDWNIHPNPSKWRRCLLISRWSDFPNLNSWFCEKALPFVCGTRPGLYPDVPVQEQPYYQ